MYDNNAGGQPGGPILPNVGPNPFYGASSGFIRDGLGAYGGEILGTSSEYVQSNISRFNDRYVKNKLKEFAEVRSFDSSRHHYLLLFIALAQFPLLIWLGNISLNWLI